MLTEGATIRGNSISYRFFHYTKNIMMHVVVGALIRPKLVKNRRTMVALLWDLSNREVADAINIKD